MLDAFIIDTMRKQQDEREWKPLPLTLELPLPEEKEGDPKEDRIPPEDPGMTILSVW